MRLKNRFVFMYTFFLVSIVFSQENDVLISLKELITKLEKSHNVKFSYSDSILKEIQVKPITNDQSIEEILRLLQQQTNLVFKKVTSRYILILEKDSEAFFCGYIIDKFSKKPVEGVNVYLENDPIGTVTDENGYFELSGIKKNNVFIMSFVGYKTISSVIPEKKDKACTSYFIEEYTSKLDEILITSYLTEGITKSNNGVIEISPQKRGILPGLTEPDVLQSLQLLPDIQSPNETTSGLNIRGGSPDHNLVLFDGIRIYSPAHFFGMISAFNPYIINKVNVHGSGVSAEYGNHIAGVINISTDTKIAKKTSGGIGSNLTHSDAFIKFPLSSKTSLQVSGRRSLTDLFNTITFQKISNRVFQNTVIIDDADNNRFYFQDVNVKLQTEISKKDKLSFSQLFISNNLDYTISSEDETFMEREQLSINNFGISGNWKRQWSDNLAQNTLLYYSNYTFDYLFFTQLTTGTPFIDTSVKKNTIKELGLKSSFNLALHENHRLGLGFEYLNNDTDFTLARTFSLSPTSDNSLIENNISNTFALFSEYKYKKEDKINLSVGVRNTLFSLEDRLSFEPRLFFQLKVFPKIWLNTSYERKFQNISQLTDFSVSDFGLENKVWTLSNNREVPLLKSNHISSGLVFRKNNWLLDVNLFYKQVNGLTSLSRQASSNSPDITSGKSITKGITALLKKKIGNYTSWMSYSLGETRYTFPSTNRGNSFSGDNDVRHNFTWSHSYNLNQFDFSLGWIYRTGIPFTNITQSTNNNGIRQFLPGRTNAERLNDYHRLDFSTTYKFNFSKSQRWKGKVGVSFLNLYNRNNTLQRMLSVSNDQTNQSLINRETSSLRFTPNFVFRVEF